MDQRLLDSLMRADQKTTIFELEGLAIVTAFDVFAEMIKGRRIVIFTDNQSVQSSVIKCKSKNDNMDLISKKIAPLKRL